MTAPRRDNYRIQAEQAKACFLTYDQEALIRKFGLEWDDRYLYVTLLSSRYRIDRRNADFQRQIDSRWINGNSFHEVMTILDLLCDSRPDRHLAHSWQNMHAFGLMFHQNLLERQDPFADRIQADPEGFRRACLTMGGEPVPGCDIGFSLELFDGLPVAIQFWFGDEEFYPRIRWLWDANALQYIRYETMHFAVPLIARRIAEQMETGCPVKTQTSI